MRHAALPRASLGFSLIEVLISILIVVVGLLGLAGLQARAQVAEFESYQRAQALVLLYDMVERLHSTHITAPCFAVTTDAANGAPYFGDGSTVTPTCSASNPADNALAVASMTEWDNLLKGGAEKKGAAATNVGAMIGARGCISYNAATEYLNASTGVSLAGTGEYTVAVSWQGMANTFAPTAACGKGLYGAEAKRRTVWATTRIGILTAQ